MNDEFHRLEQVVNAITLSEDNLREVLDDSRPQEWKDKAVEEVITVLRKTKDYIEAVEEEYNELLDKDMEED